ncbi:MAG: hypothetical protein QOK15_623 [Nocardioidaceae bacterium]|nr:hypothetical protein [Nocardioidaceae bacterium]
MTSRVPVLAVAWFSRGDLNPLSWLGSAAAEAAGQTWTAAMVASWSSGMWILDLAFRGVDAFVSPDLSAAGPMGAVYPYTFGLGLVVALVMAFVQLGVAAFRRDGQSLARLLVGIVQFGAVWLGYVGIATLVVVAASGLTHGLLQSLLHVDSFSGYRPGADWPRHVNDTVTATVLGVCAWLLIWPAAIAYLLVMLVREAALLLLAATSPIAAGGLMSEVGRAWFWKSLRWFIASVLVAPLAALVLGIGDKITEGVVSGAGSDTTAAVGMAVVGSILVLVAAICPLVLFRLLAFVDPGTSSGAAMRSSLAAQGGFAGLLSRTPHADDGSDTAAQDDGAGRSAGEASADSVTSGRFAGATSAVLGPVGSIAVGTARFAQSAVAVSSDILASSGVGHQHPYYPTYDSGTARRSPNSGRGAPGSDSPGRPPEQPPPVGGDGISGAPGAPGVGPATGPTALEGGDAAAAAAAI